MSSEKIKDIDSCVNEVSDSLIVEKTDNKKPIRSCCIVPQEITNPEDFGWRGIKKKDD